MNGRRSTIALSGRASDRSSRTAGGLRGADHLRHGGAASAGVIAAPHRGPGTRSGVGCSLARRVNPRSGVACDGGLLGNLRRRRTGSGSSQLRNPSLDA